MGKSPTVADSAFVSEMAYLVGDRVTVGHNVVIGNAGVGDDVLVGMSSTIQFGAEVESNALVAAGSLVREDVVIPSGHLAYGVPVETRELTPDQAAVIEETVDHYLDNRRAYETAAGLEQPVPSEQHR